MTIFSSLPITSRRNFLGALSLLAQSDDYYMECAELVRQATDKGFFDNLVSEDDPAIKDCDNKIENGPHTAVNY